ncbi:hypothetical protein SAMN06265373_102460 [Shimia sagamensis]|uniref:Uncharacterized protein n=1 Tax=Shimia sagamensis TaxID=1566352 RepID=A0ABY1NPW1_9RHOB|nr:hypothetical protein SAMN06265373_102460 [Shimia sagamensis]
MNKWLTDWAEFRSIKDIFNHVKHIFKQIFGPFPAFLLGFFLLGVGCIFPMWLGVGGTFVRLMRHFTFGLWSTDGMRKMRRILSRRRARHLFKIVQRRTTLAAGQLMAGVASQHQRSTGTTITAGGDFGWMWNDALPQL